MEISKALFDLSEKHIGFWNYLVFFDFVKLEKDDGIELYNRYSLIQGQNFRTVEEEEYSINDAMYEQHSYRDNINSPDYKMVFLAQSIPIYRGGYVASKYGRVWAKHFMQAAAMMEWKLFEEDPSWWVGGDEDHD